MIQPHLPVRLPCYDFTPVTNPTLGILLQKVRVTTSGITSYLYLFSQFFKDKEIEELLGEEIKTDYINDDIIGRVMDEFRIVE